MLRLLIFFVSGFVFWEYPIHFFSGFSFPEIQRSAKTANYFPQENSGTDITGLPPKVLALVDTSLEIVEWKEGFLNKDTFRDFMLVYQSKALRGEYKKGEVDDKRTLMILLADSNQNYGVLCENPRIVLCKQCGGQSGDPFAGIGINSKDIVIRHAGGADWKWQQEIVFKWSEEKKTFVLKKDETLSFNAATPNHKKKVKTMGEGVVGQTIESFDIYVKR